MLGPQFFCTVENERHIHTDEKGAWKFYSMAYAQSNSERVRGKIKGAIIATCRFTSKAQALEMYPNLEWPE